jgi:phosphohistidine phosphatase
MKLYLVQHGKSKSKEEDPDRPLTDEGRAEVQKMTNYIAASGGVVAVTKIFHSGKTRARQTAEILSENLKPQSGVETAEGLAPLDDPIVWARILAGIEEDIMLVGHLPHLSKLASKLLVNNQDEEIVKFVNSGVVCLELDNGAWTMEWMVIPELIT